MPPTEPGPDYRVTTVGFGSLAVDWTTQLYGRPPGVQIDSPVWGAVIEGGGLRILADTGIRDPATVSQTLAPCTQAAGQTPAGVLDILGWRCADIDIVINTHLHFDHCGHNSAFPSARFIVSRAEWDWAQRPNEEQRRLYAPGEWLLPPLDEARYTLVDGEHQVAPGISVLPTPGHSAGHQSVLVNTSEGLLCVAGDAVNIEENFTQRKPGGLISSMNDALRSIELIRTRADRLLMAHDPRLRAFMTSGYPTVPAADVPVVVCGC
jgi:N-acyl homoserine lactone hydrolase